MTAPARECQPVGDELRQAVIAKAQYFVDCKYVSRADERQKSMGLAYVEAERQDLARAIASFAMGHAATLQARVDELTKALEPFAAFASRFGDTARDDDWQLTNNPSGKGNLTMGDVRAARRTLSAPLEQSGSGK